MLIVVQIKLFLVPSTLPLNCEQLDVMGHYFQANILFHDIHKHATISVTPSVHTASGCKGIQTCHGTRAL